MTTDPSFDDLPALFSAVLPHGTVSTVINQDTGTIASIWTFAMTDPSTPITECKDVTPAERKAIAERTAPYDGVRTWGDLEAVRALKKNKDT